MSEKIEPALSAEEWATALEPDSRDALAYEVTYLWGRSRPAGAIAIANTALPDSDPRKITREMVDEVRRVASAINPSAADADGEESVRSLARIADALESYLPQET